MRSIFLGLVIGCAATAVVAADPPKPKASSLDDELFKGLDEATTAPGVKPKPSATAAKSDAPVPQPRPSNPLDAELLKQLEGEVAGAKSKPTPKPAAGGEGEKGPARSASDDPLLRLTEQIRDAEARLRRTETGDETQQLQQQIVDDLEKLIAQIEQQQQQRQQSQSQQQKDSSSQPKPGPSQQQPGQQQGKQESSQARDSQQGTRSTANRKADPGNLKSLLEKAWGALPERERQAVMQSSVDDFPTKYQAVIEEYFKTLLKREE